MNHHSPPRVIKQYRLTILTPEPSEVVPQDRLGPILLSPDQILNEPTSLNPIELNHFKHREEELTKREIDVRARELECKAEKMQYQDNITNLHEQQRQLQLEKQEFEFEKQLFYNQLDRTNYQREVILPFIHSELEPPSVSLSDIQPKRDGDVIFHNGVKGLATATENLFNNKEKSVLHCADLLTQLSNGILKQKKAHTIEVNQTRQELSIKEAQILDIQSQIVKSQEYHAQLAAKLKHALFLPLHDDTREQFQNLIFTNISAQKSLLEAILKSNESFEWFKFISNFCHDDIFKAHGVEFINLAVRYSPDPLPHIKYLLKERHVNLNETFSCGHIFTKTNQLEILVYIVSRYTTQWLLDKDQFQNSPLYLAFSNPNTTTLEVFQYLLENNNINWEKSPIKNPLHLIFELFSDEGDLNVVEYLSNCPVLQLGFLDSAGKSCIDYAFRPYSRTSFKLIKYIINNDWLKYGRESKYYLVHLCNQKTPSIEAIKYLCHNTVVDYAQTDTGGYTALHNLVYNPKHGISDEELAGLIQYLIDKGASVNAIPPTPGKSILLLVNRSILPKVYATLVENGANYFSGF
jgi:hypothetical protein